MLPLSRPLIAVIRSSHRHLHVQERKRELELASASLYFKGGCAVAKALILESGEEALLKQRISFWWPYEQEWFAGIVDSVSPSRERQSGRMTVLFDDGDTLIRSIAASIWRLVCWPCLVASLSSSSCETAHLHANRTTNTDFDRSTC